MIKLVQNDYGYRIIFNVRDVAGSLVPLSSAESINFKWNYSLSTSTYLNADATVYSSSTGKCYIEVPSTAFEYAGTYHGQLVLNYSDRRISGVDFAFDVKKEVPK